MICENLDINKYKFTNSSQIRVDPELTRTDKLISILETIGAKTYITPEGSLNYLREDNFTKKLLFKLKREIMISKSTINIMQKNLLNVCLL